MSEQYTQIENALMDANEALENISTPTSSPPSYEASPSKLRDIATLVNCLHNGLARKLIILKPDVTMVLLQAELLVDNLETPTGSQPTEEEAAECVKQAYQSFTEVAQRKKNIQAPAPWPSLIPPAG